MAYRQRAMKPNEKQVNLGIAALTPFVKRWEGMESLSPDELHEIVWAVITNFDREAPEAYAYQAIEYAVNHQLDDFAEQHEGKTSASSNIRGGQ